MSRGAERPLGHPRLHLRLTSSTNDLARALAEKGAPHGTLVTADEQTSGRGRHGRRWSAPPRSALLMSLILREWPPMLPLAAPLAVCDAVERVGAKGCGDGASRDALRGDLLVKWPNDVVVREREAAPASAPAAERSAAAPAGEAAPAPAAAPFRKLSGILIEGRPTEGWLVLGIGLNVAVDLSELPKELEGAAASMGLYPHAIGGVLSELLIALGQRLGEPSERTLDSWRARDALKGRTVTWSGGSGVARGVDGGGRLLVQGEDGSLAALDSGEVVLAHEAGLR